MMQPIPGGAAARPFKTHHNALDMDLYLRIAPELYLKRLVVGGLERVFEINRNFRNEGISTRHNPEFTMLEWYCAYEDWRYMMEHTEKLVRAAAGGAERHVPGQARSTSASLSRASRFRRRSASRASTGDLRDRAFLSQKLTALKVEHEKHQGWGALQLMLFEAVAEKHLIEPTFVTDFPAEVSPLSRRRDGDPEVADRFELFIDAKEIANGFSELNDPEDQAARFLEQAKAQGRRRPGSDALRRRLHPRARVRHAALRRRRPGHRPPGDAPDRQPEHPRRDPVPAHAARGLRIHPVTNAHRRPVGVSP